MLDMNISNLKYICKYMMNVNWFPKIEEVDEVLQVLNLCDSKLEVMCIFGIAYYYYNELHERIDNKPGYNIILSKKTFQTQEGICFSPLYMKKFNTYHGPFDLIAVPQYRSPEKNIHHDIGLFLSVPDVRMHNDSIKFFSCVVEIDGYSIHRNRRELDERRIADLSYPVIRVFEEQTETTRWFHQYLEEFSRLPYNNFFWDSVPQWRGEKIECPSCGEVAYQLDLVCENCHFDL